MHDDDITMLAPKGKLYKLEIKNPKKTFIKEKIMLKI